MTGFYAIKVKKRCAWSEFCHSGTVLTQPVEMGGKIREARTGKRPFSLFNIDERDQCFTIILQVAWIWPNT